VNSRAEESKTGGLNHRLELREEGRRSGRFGGFGMLMGKPVRRNSGAKKEKKRGPSK